jgi:hypothetical protein
MADCALALALASSVVAVVPERGAPVAVRAAPTLPWQVGEVVLDGAFEDAAWGDAAWRGLFPADAARTSPAVAMAVVADPAGLVVGLRGEAGGLSAEVRVDPDGMGQRALRWASGRAAEVCTLADVNTGAVWPVGPGAVPCDPGPAPQVASGPAGWELLWPWEALARASSRLTIAATVRGPQGRVGTTSRTGALSTAFGEGWHVAAPGLGATLKVATALPGEDRYTLTVTRPPGAPTAWAWSRWLEGRRVDGGTVSVVGRGDIAWTAPPVAAQGVFVEVRDAGQPVAAAVHAVVPRKRVGVDLVTPVHDGAFVLHGVHPNPWTASVRVSLDGGREACASADLPAGEWLWTVDLPDGTGDALVTLPDGRTLAVVAATARRGR